MGRDLSNGNNNCPNWINFDCRNCVLHLLQTSSDHALVLDSVSDILLGLAQLSDPTFLE